MSVLENNIRWERGFPKVIQCPNEWLDIIEMCWVDCDKACKTCEVAQIKSKFGGLRFYVECRCEDYIHESELQTIVSKYEQLVYTLEKLNTAVYRK